MPNEKLTLSDLPAEDASASELRAFAGGFDGYAAAGGFQECAKIAMEPNMDSITELRIAMFFSVRAARHCDDDFESPEPTLCREYVSRIREILLERGSA